MKKISQICIACGKQLLSKDETGICKKLLGSDTRVYFCLPCFADHLMVTEQDILDKIEEFKAEGCTLFS